MAGKNGWKEWLELPVKMATHLICSTLALVEQPALEQGGGLCTCEGPFIASLRITAGMGGADTKDGTRDGVKDGWKGWQE